MSEHGMEWVVDGVQVKEQGAEYVLTGETVMVMGAVGAQLGVRVAV